MKRYKPIKKLNELTLADLKGNQGMSDLTSRFRKERNKIMGSESTQAKLIDVEIDETAKYVTFVWLTIPTEKYPKNYKYKDVDIEGNKSIHLNRSKTYELKIRILDFFDWLETYPDKTEITVKDIKEIFEVSDIKVSSNDPSFQYQGQNYYLSSVFDGSIYPTNIPAPIWGPKHGNGDGLIGKHLQGLINGIKFWQNPMASMLTKRLKDRELL
jgi:hypothetical protein